MTDQPIVHPVAQPQDHRSAETFTFQSEAGPVTVPKFKRVMNLGFVRKNRDLSEQEVMFQALEANCTAEQLDALDQLDLLETERFFQDWQRDSGVGLGESARS